MIVRYFRTIRHLHYVTHRCASTSSGDGAIYNFVADLKSRGLLLNSYPTDVLSCFQSSLRSLSPSLYAGFDPTADSLHIGNLLVLINLLRSTQFGCQPIVLVGEATAAIGDPSGRTTERDELSSRVIEENAFEISQFVMQIDNHVAELLGRKSTTKFVNNLEWYKNMSMVEYLRLCRPFRVSEMMRMGAIKNRMGENDGISFTEFSYQTMQSLDWLHLAKLYACNFQVGGSDQLGHLDQGAHLIKRVENKFAAGVCLPLVTDSSGNKLGKSTGAGIWLSSKRTSPFYFFQFWRQLDDKVAEEFLWKFSLKNIEEIAGIVEDHRKNLGRWVAQDSLAHEVTQIVHGSEGLETAVKCSKALFEGSISDLEALENDTIIDLFGSVTKIRRDAVSSMGEMANLTRTDKQKGDQLMKKGAFKVNGEKVTDPSLKMNFSKLIIKNTENLTLVCWGKRKYQLIQWI